MGKYTFWMSAQLLLRCYLEDIGVSLPQLTEPWAPSLRMRTRNAPPSVLVDATMTFTYILQTGDPLIGTFACHGGVTGGTVLGQVMPCHAYTHQSSWYISYAPWSKTESTKPYSSLAPFPTTFQCSDATALSPQAPSAPQAPLAPPGSIRQLSRFKMISPWPTASKRIHLTRKPSYTPQPLPWPETKVEKSLTFLGSCAVTAMRLGLGR